MEFYDYGLILSKFAIYVGALFSTGLVSFRLIFETPETKPHLHLKNLIILFSFLGLAATIINFALSGAAMSGEMSGMYDLEILGIIWSTAAKYALIARLVGFCILLFAIFFMKKISGVHILGALFVLGSFSLTGHVSQTGQLLFSFLLFIHIALIALWVGILIPLIKLCKNITLLKPTAQIARRFGQIAGFFVPVLIIAGGIISFELVGSLQNLMGTGYGINLLVKVGLVGIVLTSAAYHKLMLVPAMLSGDTKAGERLYSSVIIETMLVLGVMLATAFLTSVQTLPGTE